MTAIRAKCLKMCFDSQNGILYYPRWEYTIDEWTAAKFPGCFDLPKKPKVQGVTMTEGKPAQGRKPQAEAPEKAPAGDNTKEVEDIVNGRAIPSPQVEAVTPQTFPPVRVEGQKVETSPEDHRLTLPQAQTCSLEGIKAWRCECGEMFTPGSNAQRYCQRCRSQKYREKANAWDRANRPGRQSSRRRPPRFRVLIRDHYGDEENPTNRYR